MKQVGLIIFIIISFFIIHNLFQSIYSLWQKQDLLTTAKKDLEKEKLVNEKLKQQTRLVQSSSYVEQQARDKLLLVKPDEQIVVLPQNLIVSTISPTVTPLPKKPNWQQWVNLFLHN